MANNTILLTKAPGSGYAYAISFLAEERTSLLAAATAFKACVSRDERQWRAPRWLFRRTALKVVRQFAVEYTERHGWQLIDTTVMERSVADQVLAKIEQQERERRVAAFLALLPDLPDGVLRLAGWFPEALVFERAQYRLDDRTYRALMQASIPDYQLPHLPIDGGFAIPSDPAIIAAVVLFLPLLMRRIERLQIHASLTPVQRFEDGVVHWQDEKGELWFGAPHHFVVQEQAWMITLPGDTYHCTLEDETIYLIGSLDTILRGMKHWGRRMLMPLHVAAYVPPGTATDERIAALLRTYHLQGAFVTWVSQQIASQECEPSSSYAPHHTLWETPWNWTHPGAGIIRFFLSTRPEQLLAIMGWSDADVEAHAERIEQLRVHQARCYLAHCREHAVALAVPLLRQKTKEELLALGARYGIVVRRSWTRERMSEALSTAGAKSVQLAGVLLRLPEAVGPVPGTAAAFDPLGEKELGWHHRYP